MTDIPSGSTGQNVTPMTTIDLAALRMLAEKATPGDDRIGAGIDCNQDQRDCMLAFFAARFALLDRLAAAEAVVEAARYLREPALLTDPPRFPLRDALAAFDRAIAGQQQQEGTT